MSKRTFDVVVAGIGLCLLFPLFALVALVICLDSPGPIFFRQERIGRGLQPFRIYKFRTMIADAERRGGQITYGQDPRITRTGRLLRKIKLDELPQLLNVLNGDMSLVGPRPEVPRYVELFREDYRQVLTVRPGITDLASLRYRDEATLLSHSTNPENEYVTHILPDKIALAKQYSGQSSFLFDLRVIAKTIAAICGYRVSV
ncbi:MAG: sugar transferase [Candidatus Binatia bacterium]